MSRWFGKIGYSATEQTSPGVFEEHIVERSYYGDAMRVTSKFQNAEKLNDDLNISNEFSILADPFAFENFSAMRYIEFLGERWKITNVEVQYPRLRLSVGGVYNGEQA